MKPSPFQGIVLICVLCLLSGCAPQRAQGTQPATAQTTEAAAQNTTAPSIPEETAAAATEAPTQPSPDPTVFPGHSELYIPGVSADDVIMYFNEVCLAAEIINYGDPTKLQRWENPIQYICIGDYTDTDKSTLDAFTAWLNTLEGFPGIQETQDVSLANLRIYFCGQADYLSLMGDGFSGTDGGITFWYNEADEIYDAVIGCRTDIEQEVRNSVILEELYNGLGPINDTQLRPDSVIYSAFSTPQELSRMDMLILKLLYHPQMQCGMDKDSCEAVIRQLYY